MPVTTLQHPVSPCASTSLACHNSSASCISLCIYFSCQSQLFGILYLHMHLLLLPVTTLQHPVSPCASTSLACHNSSASCISLCIYFSCQSQLFGILYLPVHLLLLPVTTLQHPVPPYASTSLDCHNSSASCISLCIYFSCQSQLFSILYLPMHLLLLPVTTLRHPLSPYASTSLASHNSSASCTSLCIYFSCLSQLFSILYLPVHLLLLPVTTLQHPVPHYASTSLASHNSSASCTSLCIYFSCLSQLFSILYLPVHLLLLPVTTLQHPVSPYASTSLDCHNFSASCTSLCIYFSCLSQLTQKSIPYILPPEDTPNGPMNKTNHFSQGFVGYFDDAIKLAHSLFKA